MSMSGPQRALTASQILSNLQSSLPADLSTSSNPSLKKKASSDLSSSVPCRKKKKRVHFNDLASSNDSIQVNGPNVVQEFNLCQAKNICHYLQRHYRTSSGSTAGQCVGYLETPCQMYKHKFYFQDRTTATKIGISPPEITTVFSIFDIMRQDAEDALEQEDQLRLAHKTAIAMLQYHDTPWLAERWRLSNLSYFGNQHNLDEAALKTLHFSSQISSPTQSITNTAAMEGVQETGTAVSDEIKYGINNLPLFFLGVALLEIAHWKPLESKMTARDQNDEVFTARRLALGRAPLGPEYQKIAQKCLQCNFGFGTKLSSKSLQTAVYNDVVCELEGMIERLAV